jgi:hypothetical protein
VEIRDNPLSLVETRRNLNSIINELKSLNDASEVREELMKNIILTIEILEAMVNRDRERNITNEYER